MNSRIKFMKVKTEGLSKELSCEKSFSKWDIFFSFVLNIIIGMFGFS